MFNVALKLRQPSGLVEPVGPSFARARTIVSDIDGTTITFKAPKHRPIRSNHEGYTPRRHYAEADLTFRNYYDEQKAERGLPDHWRKADFFYHSWAFNGPWFMGAVAELDMSFKIVKAVNYPDDMSVFHPRVLEQVIGDYLTDLYSHHRSNSRGGIQVFKAPTHWQPLHTLPVNAARLEVFSENFSPHRTIKRMVFFPLSHNLLAVLLFWPSRIKNLPRAELDKRVNEKPVLALMDNIIASVELTLSPKAQEQQAEALKGLADTSLVTDYPPLKWDTLSEEDKLEILAAQN